MAGFEQLTIFDFLEHEKEERSIEELSVQEIAEIIGNAIGFTFGKSKRFDGEYEVQYKKGVMFSISKSRYSCDVGKRKKGDAFISVSMYGKEWGRCSPQDSVEDAIRFFEWCMKEEVKW